MQAVECRLRSARPSPFTGQSNGPNSPRNLQATTTSSVIPYGGYAYVLSGRISSTRAAPHRGSPFARGSFGCHTPCIPAKRTPALISPPLAGKSPARAEKQAERLVPCYAITLVTTPEPTVRPP